MNYKIFLTSLTALIVILLGGYLYLIMQQETPVVTLPLIEATTFQECVDAGFPVLESFPRQCSTADKKFVEYIGNIIEKENLITLETPRPNDKVTSTFTLKGQARGYWYFEASFPINIKDDKGNVLYSSFVMADGEWMTENFVPFTKEITFDIPAGVTKGFLELHKDNPSGLPEHDDVLIIPINF